MIMDRTREIREKLNKPGNIDFGNEEIIANGMLPEDYENFKYGDVGEAGILRIENQSGKTINGNGVVFKTTTEAIPKDYQFDRTSKLVSQRSHLKLILSEDLKLKDSTIQGLNTIPQKGKEPYMVYDSKKPFEHGIDIEACEDIIISNVTINNVFGDGIYIRRYAVHENGAWHSISNKNIRIIGGKIHGNGRQGIGIVDGNGILIDGIEIDLSRRGIIDIEPNTPDETVENIIIRNIPYGRGSLYAFPMGGRGKIKNGLIENNKLFVGAATYCVGQVFGDRENITYRGNTYLYPFGSPLSRYVFKNAKNIVIEDEKGELVANRSGKIIYLENCENVVIRNNDFKNAKYIVLKNTDPSQVKVYGNVQALNFLIVPESFNHDNGDAYTAREDSDIIPIEEYDVEKYGEPEVHPDPVLPEKQEPEPEPPIEEPEPTPIPEPEKPTDQKPEKKKNKTLIYIAIGIIIAISLTLILL